MYDVQNTPHLFYFFLTSVPTWKNIPTSHLQQISFDILISTLVIVISQLYQHYFLKDKSVNYTFIKTTL